MKGEGRRTKVEGGDAKPLSEADFDLLPQELRLAFLEAVRPAGQKLTLEVVGEMIGITRDRVRQIEAGALVKLRTRARQLGLDHTLGDVLSAGRQDGVKQTAKV